MPRTGESTERRFPRAASLPGRRRAAKQQLPNRRCCIKSSKADLPRAVSSPTVPCQSDVVGGHRGWPKQPRSGRDGLFGRPESPSGIGRGPLSPPNPIRERAESREKPSACAGRICWLPAEMPVRIAERYRDEVTIWGRSNHTDWPTRGKGELCAGGFSGYARKAAESRRDGVGGAL